MILLVLVSGNHTGSITEHTGLGSTHPHIILWYGEPSLQNFKYVYKEVAFDSGG